MAGPPVAEAQYRTFLLGENDGLIATMRVASPASLAEDWLQIVIANTGPAGVIESARVLHVQYVQRPPWQHRNPPLRTSRFA